MSAALWIDLSDELLEALAQRVAELLAERGGLMAARADMADPWLRGADAIAEHIGAARSRVYALHSAGRLPCVGKDGSALIARRSDLDHWMQNGGGKRP